MNVESFIFLTVISLFHFVFDFIFQTNKMAQNKSKCIGALSQHVFVYTLGMVACSQYLYFMGYFITVKIALNWALINGMVHWLTDFITSKINTFFYKKGNIHTFFVGVGFDQMIHAITLTGSYLLVIAE
jgi:hypothetical protein